MVRFREIAVTHINSLESRPVLRRELTETDIQRYATTALTALNSELAETTGSELAEADIHPSEKDMMALLSPELAEADARLSEAAADIYLSQRPKN